MRPKPRRVLPDVDLDAGKVTIVRQLAATKLADEGGVQFGPPKTGKARTVDVGAETVALLRAHKREQAAVKLKNRVAYRDLGLIFANDPAKLGMPLPMKKLGNGELARLLAAANVRRITFHGLRHTSATLLLLGGESAKVVSERLGHSTISMTLDIYSHVLPSMGTRGCRPPRPAAARLTFC